MCGTCHRLENMLGVALALPLRGSAKARANAAQEGSEEAVPRRPNNISDEALIHRQGTVPQQWRQCSRGPAVSEYLCQCTATGAHAPEDGTCAGARQHPWAPEDGTC